MKEYATLVTDDVSSAYSYPTFSRRESQQGSWHDENSVIQRLMKDGWEVIDASTLPKLAFTHEDRPRFAFMLERTIPDGGEKQP